ncbi:uncharacterized protein LOC128162619 [Crassostrea angulata]|uniref:uncharacterized protein LOC128162619 n=1 Tax=Magallana angulata TaxID=2784310 RepID=UPI0022B1FE13|nr:uncharacterized protein LOC128162619 [Crassostrea angulata]
MDPRHSAQDVVSCHLCEAHVPPYFCDICQINLCKTCAGEHLLDESQVVHRVLPITQRRSTPNYPKCSKHVTKHCELHCEQCDIPICVHCVSSGEHLGHRAVDILENFERLKEKLRNDLQELEESIYPKYQEIASNIPVQIAELNQNAKKLKSEISKRGEDWHKEIDTIINKMQSDVNEVESKQLTVLNELRDEINDTMSDITKNIADLKKILDSNDVYRNSEYKSNIAKFKTQSTTSKRNVSLPIFTFQMINTDELFKKFGSLLAPSKMESIIPAEISALDRPLLDVPKIITTIDTRSTTIRLQYVACLNDEAIWTKWDFNSIDLYDRNGKLLRSIQTKSGYTPVDIAVTKSGSLVYTDVFRHTVNIERRSQIEDLIRISGKPLSICSTSSEDLLVMVKDWTNKTKVVRYSGSTIKQSIQFDNKNQPLYSSGEIQNICENKNLDICVADWGGCAVVVVNLDGNFRFRYNCFTSTTNKPFKPYGIVTDSQSCILVGDSRVSFCIQILDKDGQFIRNIDCGLLHPMGLCVDSRDNLFVAEDRTGKIKKIQYYT